MSSSVYDDDDLLGDPTTIEEIVEVELEEEADGSDNDQNLEEGGNAETEENAVPELQTAPEGVPVDPKKKRVVKNPQPKLNPARLMGPRGIAVLEDTFKDFQFNGKGFEKSDLNQLMKRLEHWAHRLFPKFTFDDCLQKIENLGHKNEVKTYVKRLRMGLVNDIEPASLCDEVNEKEELIDEPIDAFDALIGQQLSLSHASQSHTAVQDASHSLAQTESQSTVKMLTEEQKERMRRNRLIAEQRKLERLKALHMVSTTSTNEVQTATQDSNRSDDNLSKQNTDDGMISTGAETSAPNQNNANIDQMNNPSNYNLNQQSTDDGVNSTEAETSATSQNNANIDQMDNPSNDNLNQQSIDDGLISTEAETSATSQSNANIDQMDNPSNNDLTQQNTDDGVISTEAKTSATSQNNTNIDQMDNPSNDNLNQQSTDDGVISTEAETSATSQNNANIDQMDNPSNNDLARQNTDDGVISTEAEASATSQNNANIDQMDNPSNDNLNQQSTDDGVISTEAETSATSQNNANIDQMDNMLQMDLQTN